MEAAAIFVVASVNFGVYLLFQRHLVRAIVAGAVK